MTPRPDHLVPLFPSDRGFACMPALSGRSGEAVTVSESTLDAGPHLWLSVVDGQAQVLVHLSAEDAWKLADQLRTLVENHYHGDARPEWAR